jgi:hypothetical protein
MNSIEPHTIRSGKAFRSVNCPCCSASTSRSIYRVGSVPVHSCVLLDSAEEANSFPRRELELAFCETCGFVFNKVFDEEVMAYSTNFEESQHFSGTFNGFARGLAQEIARKCELAGKHILEIGCGKGEFLRELCVSANATGLGIDPGYRADNGRGEGDADVQFIVDFFGPDYRRLKADAILCRHTLEHISSVASFVRLIREMIGQRTDDWVVFETPDAKRVLAESAFWDIYYEHCSYFSPGAHARLFRQEGFDVTDLDLVYDGQYIVQYAKPSTGGAAAALPLERDLEEMHRLAETFPIRVRACLHLWQERMRSAHASGRRVVLWGGGSKAVSFLTTLQIGEEVSAAVDINPYKQGKFTPGTGHPVIAPAELIASPPDLVVVMNPVYITEVRRSLDALGLRPEVVSV